MEKIVFKCVENAKDKKLEGYETKIKDLELKIQQQNQYRQKKLYEYGDTIYIWQNKENEKKVGSSDNMNVREKVYFSHNREGEMIYTKRCNNRKILEDVVHHMLRKHTIDNKKNDWFDLPVSVIKEAIDSAQIFLDLFSENVSVLSQIKLSETLRKIYDASKTSQEYLPEPEPMITEDTNTIIQVLADKIREEESLPRKIVPEPVKETTLREMAKIPQDFDRFLKECFETRDNVDTSWIDIGARYRIWSRTTDNYKDALNTYLIESGFKRTFIYEEATKCKLAAFTGIKMIPLPPIVLPENPTIVELFLYKNCVANVTGRLAIKDIRERFVEWKKKQVDSTCTKLSKSEKNTLKAHLDKAFVAATVHTGERIRFGYYGVSFIGMEHIGKKMKMGNRKVVLQIDSKTNSTVNKYDSITHAANALGVSISRVSVALSSDRSISGYRFAFEEPTTGKPV